MTYYANQRLSTANTLTHHGVKGQHWGIKNGPPYPIDQQRISDGYREIAKKQGYKGKDIDTVAKARERYAKMALAAGGAFLAVGGAYCLYRYVNQNLDTVIKAGTAIQRVTDSADVQVRDRFYATANNLDKLKYQGIYGTQINTLKNKDAFSKVMTSNSDIKVAGINTSKKVYAELKKKYPDDLKIYSYESFNKYFLIQQSGKQADIAKEFFNELQKKGYGGVIDWNDSRSSGYNSIRPVVFFNQSGNMKVKSVTKLGKDTVTKKTKKGLAIAILQNQLSNKANLVYAGGSAGYGYLSLRKAYKTGSRKKKK